MGARSRKCNSPATPAIMKNTSAESSRLQLKILLELIDERNRQNKKFGTQNHSPIEWIAILTEEVGEAAKEALELHFKSGGGNAQPDSTDWHSEKTKLYRAEMVQVAAVALSMIECIDRDEWVVLGGKLPFN